MQYVIWSHGRMVGASDLAFAGVDRRTRCGWIYPTVEGERLMPAATAVPEVLRASREREAADSPDIPGIRGPARQADLAEALHRVAALELELRDAAGVLIPTVDISIQDTYLLLELARDAEAAHGAEAWEGVDDPAAAFGVSAALCTQETDEEGAWDEWREHVAADADSHATAELDDDDAGICLAEHYQLFVTLADPASVP